MLRKLWPLLPIAAVALLLWLIFPFGFPNYDTVYMLVWGDQIAHGISPDTAAPLAPTPHPLAEIWGAVISPLGATAASDLTTLLAYLALGAIAYLVYRLGELWFDRPIGIVAAALVLTRAPFLSNGLRAYVDLPYICLVLAALALESRRPRAGWPVLALLAAAGLLRPEAWLFSVAYLAYLLLERDPAGERLALRRRSGIAGRRLAILVVLAASGPLLWALFDLITVGDPLYSFTGTRDTVETLERETGPIDLILYGPRRLGEVMQIPGLFGAAAGMLLGLAFLRRRSLLGVAAAVLAGLAFAILASAGLAIIPRYTMLASAVLCVFCALALLGWRLLAADHSWRRPWQADRGADRDPLRGPAPAADRLPGHGPDRPRRAERRRVGPVRPRGFGRLSRGLRSDLGPEPPRRPQACRLARRHAFRHRQLHPAAPAGARLLPRPGQDEVVRNFVLDPNDPARYEDRCRRDSARSARNDSWRLYARCG